ncbi:MAG: FAD-binding oxidoreductase, partial [Flavobacteriaceae bacterium]|nr:FAD-binding oxidoreductase [Flavobacteriaceae bacterium]
DTAIDFKQYGGFELFNLEDSNLFDSCLRERENINKLLEPIFKAKAFIQRGYEFGFKNINTQAIFNPFEGQLHTGKMMASLIERVQSKSIKILNSVHVKAFSETGSGVEISTAQFNFKTRKLLIATNGFAAQLIEQPVKPARAQVLITKPIKNLHIKGVFNLDRGYYYFRNINQRILFGGGRNLDFKAEETSELGQTALVQNHLEKLLKTVILPDTPFEIEQRWSGIMGVGKQKKPIVKALSNHVYCGVRLGGMGVAIGSLIGKELADLL